MQSRQPHVRLPVHSAGDEARSFITLDDLVSEPVPLDFGDGMAGAQATGAERLAQSAFREAQALLRTVSRW